jgi:hypothetical protein
MSEQAEQAAYWCVVANMKAVAFGPNPVSAGTRHFSAGTKVWVLRTGWGDGFERAHVIGRSRGSRRLIRIVQPTERLTNWRVQLVYSPAVIGLMTLSWTEGEARAMAASMQRHAPDELDLRGAGHRVTRAIRAIGADPQGRALVELAAAALEQGSGDPPELQVLRDWLVEREIGIEPERLALLALRQHRQLR